MIIKAKAIALEETIILKIRLNSMSIPIIINSIKKNKLVLISFKIKLLKNLNKI
jgi:hypothetical protein